MFADPVDLVKPAKDMALRTFLQRLQTNLKRPRMGSPMHFPCKGCQADLEVPEDFHPPRPEYCEPCKEIVKNGWLEGFLLIASRVDG